ncbi:MAG: winged helix-turn-helix transcriptional regulator [Hungatella sp.]|nr:winged helix-turn-helix transcriptional regulator [Hungatella sp.]
MRFQKTFRALSDPTRRGILNMLKEGPAAAGEIGEHFAVSGATISHHLSILKDAGLILDDRQGKYIYYELNMSVVDDLIVWVTGLKGEHQDE